MYISMRETKGQSLNVGTATRDPFDGFIFCDSWIYPIDISDHMMLLCQLSIK